MTIASSLCIVKISSTFIRFRAAYEKLDEEDELADCPLDLEVDPVSILAVVFH